MGYILTGILGLAVLAAFVWRPVPPDKFKGISSSQIPQVIGSYKGVDIPLDPVVRAALPSADIIDRRYESKDGPAIDVTVIGGTGRNELHDPRSCLVGAGWQIQNDRVEKLAVPADIFIRTCQVSQTTHASISGDSETSSDDMMYLYVVNGSTVASASAIRWNLLKSDLLEQNDQPVYFIRTITPLYSSPGDSAANAAVHERLEHFTAELWKALSPIILPGGRG
jgi:hypothetical protein